MAKRKQVSEAVPAAAAHPRRSTTSKRRHASETLRLAVTFKGQSVQGPTKVGGHSSPESVGKFLPLPGEVEEAISVLARHGFVVTGQGRATLSVRGTRTQFERAFGTRLSAVKLPSPVHCESRAVYYPRPGAPWAPAPDIAAAIDDAYIQWPHELPLALPEVSRRKRRPKVAARAASSALDAQSMSSLLPLADGNSTALAQPPSLSGALDVWRDVPELLKVAEVHAAGNRGKGIRVAMLDTGFDHRHPFFQGKGLLSSVALAPGASDRDEDADGHGTAMSANLLSVAPEITFIGVKVARARDDLDDPGTSMLEALQEALRHDPHVINISIGYRLEEPGPLPNGMRAVEAEINAALASGIVIVAAAGNGVRTFPAQMPGVLAVGGAFFDTHKRLVASDYASAFSSLTYSGRNVPDLCGLVGPAPHAAYIMLPVPASSLRDEAYAAHDGTLENDGWAVFSGTSAAAPQVAGVCALVLQRNSSLRPAVLKALLERTARDVKLGRASPETDPGGVGLAATTARDGATGAGLVDAFRAWTQA